MTDTPVPDVLFERRGALGLITLNRPKALNALTRDMCLAIRAQLKTWAGDEAIKAVAIRGAGEKAFSAGGDVRALYESGKAKTSYIYDFYADEYRLNTFIKRYPKPYVALINGIVMGGGVGVSVHGSHRLVGENALFAMPETGIGLFPDVGGTYFLPRCPGEIGMYLALTGARIGAADMCDADIATRHVPFAAFDAVLDKLAAGQSPDKAIEAHAATPTGARTLMAHRSQIDSIFAHDSVGSILAACNAGGAWPHDVAATIRTKSPTSLKITHRQMREGLDLDFEDCMRLEYRLTCRIAKGHDFYEGVRAVIIDKDQKPRWKPDSLEGVSDADVDAYFAPLGAQELDLTPA